MRGIKLDMKPFSLRDFWNIRKIIVITARRKIFAIKAVLVAFVAVFHDVKEIWKWEVVHVGRKSILPSK